MVPITAAASEHGYPCRMDASFSIGRRTVRATNLEKLFFPETGFTKREVLQYYLDINSIILPHLKNRPLTLKRYPEGVRGSHFYEKDAPKYTPDWVKTFAVRRHLPRGSETTIDYVLVNDAATLVWTANLANIEMHTFLAKAPHLERPTAMVFDLDPGEPAGVLDCARVALRIRTLLEGLGLASFVKVSGSKGLHVLVPLNTPRASYETTGPFAQTVARYLTQELPDLVVATMAKHARRGKVFVDWSQNDAFKSTVAAYSLRAGSGRPFVSMPVTWHELERALKKNNAEALYFSPTAARKRIEKQGDLFSDVLRFKQKLPEGAVSAKAPRNARAPKGSPARRGTDLKAYQAKRDVTLSGEPPPKIATQAGKTQRFVIQKHQASHLHYDLRLEMEGVLRSWAVPKGPSLTPGEARLAMHVEDHPIDYIAFEGTIPPGNYGAGTVMVWDTGAYTTKSGHPVKDYHAGKIELRLEGKKLRGEWVLLRQPRAAADAYSKRDAQWLLIRHGGEGQPLAKKDEDRSVLSGRTLAEIAGPRPAQRRRSSSAPAPSARKGSVRSAAMLKALPEQAPKFVTPMRPEAVATLPDGPEWLYEVKFDGFRTLILKQEDKVMLRSRNDRNLSDQYPSLVAAGRELRCRSAVVDGEIVLLDTAGRPSFQGLQNFSAAADEERLRCFVFDLLNLDGRSLTSLPLEKRRTLLQRIIPEGPIQVSEALQGDPEAVLRGVRELGLEGVVAKRKDSQYDPGRRGGVWLKVKLNAEQEFVIGGWTKGNPFDALLVGYYEDGRLLYAGKVRAGFHKPQRQDVARRLATLPSADCPFANVPENTSGRWGEGLTRGDMAKCSWVKPTLVAQIAFREWTHARHLRHAQFIGLRSDKPARDVRRETLAYPS